MKNKRILKKLSRKSTEYLPNIKWDWIDCSPSCEQLGYLSKGTPVLWYSCSYEYEEYETECAWSVLKRLFMSHKRVSYNWIWGEAPTPENVFGWADWTTELEEITEKRLGF